ncbi:SDR family NAD(P)-dependent oxidoreductase [Rhodococcus sp. NPDC056960]|uniref:SDR family NAD(P)-dependent oxidoreductase n=1 Tax=Rhodococcus sp. NPDC056960 TaxID=3345982 RepID=UPI003638BB72
MQTDLAGKVALVTGGGAGIGAELSRRLSQRGATVLVLDRDLSAAKSVANAIDRGTAVQMDLADSASIALALADNAALREVDILVNNAGLTRVERFVDSDPSAWDTLWQVNLRAPMQLCRAIIPEMTKRGWGRVVFVATDSARAGGGGEGIYSATKAGLLGFSKTLARETARDGITSNVVCPGLIDTAMLQSVAENNAALMNKLIGAIPMRRMGSADEVAAAIEFLCSADSGYVTGQTFSVNGGITMM